MHINNTRALGTPTASQHNILDVEKTQSISFPHAPGGHQTWAMGCEVQQSVGASRPIAWRLVLTDRRPLQRGTEKQLTQISFPHPPWRTAEIGAAPVTAASRRPRCRHSDVNKRSKHSLNHKTSQQHWADSEPVSNR